MIFVSLVINTVVFFLVFNGAYLKRKKQDPSYPARPVAKLILFPVALGAVFTLIVDGFKGIMIYQMVLFLVAAVLLYWIFYGMGAKKR